MTQKGVKYISITKLLAISRKILKKEVAKQMEQNVKISMLNQIYGGLLTKKQNKYIV